MSVYKQFSSVFALYDLPRKLSVTFSISTLSDHVFQCCLFPHRIVQFVRTYKIHSFVSYYNNLTVPFIPSPEYILVNDLISFPVFYKRRECECDVNLRSWWENGVEFINGVAGSRLKQAGKQPQLLVFPRFKRKIFPSFRHTRSAAPLNLIRKILVTVAIKSIGGQ